MFKLVINFIYWILIINYAFDSPYKSLINQGATLVILFFIGVLILKTKTINFITIEVITLFLFVFFSLLSGTFIAIDINIFLSKLFSVIQGLLILIISIFIVVLNKSEKSNLLLLSIIPIILSVYLLLTGEIDFTFGNNYSIERISVGGLNPNILGHVLIMGIIGIIYIAYLKKSIFIFYIPFIPLIRALALYCLSDCLSGLCFLYRREASCISGYTPILTRTSINSSRLPRWD